MTAESTVASDASRHHPKPASVFARHRLTSKEGWNNAGNVPEFGPAFSVALGELGDLYAVFGRFLMWRADLIDAATITALRDLKTDFPVIPISAIGAKIQIELGPEAGELVACLAGEPLWNTFSRTAYRSRYRGQAVVVQLARDPVTPEQFREFEENLRGIRRPEAQAMLAPAVLGQFREWVRNGESIERERKFLQVLSRHQGDTLAGYPEPIAELSTNRVLCWPLVEGCPVKELLAKGHFPESYGVPVLVASAILEQFYSLSMVDADPDPAAMVIDGNQRLHFRRLHSPIAVTPSVINNGIKYMSAVLAGNASVSAQMLIRMMYTRPPLDLEKMLMDEFSGVEPELKINMWFPPSAATFESNWRALARLEPARPLFLDSLQRNLVASGYWNAESVRSGAPANDAISEAQWPVIGGLIRTQFNMLLNRDTAVDWAVGSGLAMSGALREMNRLMEEMRDNDLTVGVEMANPARSERKSGSLSWGLVLAGLFMVLLGSVLLGGRAPAPWPALLKVIAAGTLPAMFWAVSRIE